MPKHDNDDRTDDVIILVDFGDGHLLQVDSDDLSPDELARIGKKSAEAVDKAFDTIRWIAKKAKSTLKNLNNKPDEMELEFGIAVTAKAGMLVFEGTGEFHIKARLVWKNSGSR
jgi:hypothetical protein